MSYLLITRRIRAAATIVAATFVLPAGRMRAQDRFAQTNLVSSIPGLALNTDPQLRNPWGISFGPTSPFWVSDNGTGLSTLYNGNGVKQGLVVLIPGAFGAQGVPTGQVFNNAGAFPLSGATHDLFLFAGEDGTISAWQPAFGTHAQIVVPSLDGSSYKGLAIAGTGSGARLYGANFGRGTVDVFDADFGLILPGSFVDPALPPGYAPFNVQNLGGLIYVTYAVKAPGTIDDVPGPGNGIVDVYDQNGVLQRRLVSGGALNSPWGLTLAPTGFGAFGGDLLVGNFGDGTIHAFDPNTGSLIGELLDLAGVPIVNDGLWAITFGNAGVGSDPHDLYFSAGLNGERDGLIGRLSTVPEPATMLLLATGLVPLALGSVSRRRSARRSGAEG